MDTPNNTVLSDQDRASPETGVAACEPWEGQLVEASQAGDQEAFAQLVLRYQRMVFTLSLRLVNDYDEASEITQEAFLAAWQGLPGFRGEARFSTWLYRITYHCGMRQLEKQKRERALQEAMVADLSARIRGREKLLEDVVEKHEQQALVRANLESLPVHYRLVLVLRDFQEMTYQEIASRLSLPMGTIKTHLFRARQLLKQRMRALALEQQG